MNYAQKRDLYYRSFSDDTLRQAFLLFLYKNPQLKKLHKLFDGFFLPEDFLIFEGDTHG